MQQQDFKYFAFISYNACVRMRITYVVGYGKSTPHFLHFLHPPRCKKCKKCGQKSTFHNYTRMRA